MATYRASQKFGIDRSEPNLPKIVLYIPQHNLDGPYTLAQAKAEVMLTLDNTILSLRNLKNETRVLTVAQVIKASPYSETEVTRSARPIGVR